MILLTASEDLTSLATILQVILAAGSFVLLFTSFRLQAGMFAMQQKITETQLKQAKIDAMTYRLYALDHTKRIMPKLTATLSSFTKNSINGVTALFDLNLVFTSNSNITKDIEFMVETEEGDIWLEIDQPFENPIIHPEQHFDFHAKFGGCQTKVMHYSSRLHFILNFKDDDLKPYIQHIYMSFGGNEVHIRNDVPVLKKYVS